MALPEGQIIICGECGAPMGSGVIQRDGTIRYMYALGILDIFSLFARIISNIYNTQSRQR